MFDISLQRVGTNEVHEYRDALALLIGPQSNQISFCVRNPDGSVSEVQRYSTAEWEILIT